MSLQVWLPLNNSLKNNGFAAATVTNNGATANNQYYSFSSAYTYLSVKNGLPQTSTCFSFCAWVYRNEQTSWGTIYSQRTTVGSGFSLFSDGANNNTIRFDGGEQWYVGYSLPNNTWVHICATFDNGQKKFYVNGKLFNKTESSNISDLGTIGMIGASSSSDNGVADGNQWSGNIRDVRIYDHCLSAKEIKEISKGLILHYKMDNTTYYDCSGLGYNGTPEGGITLTSDTARYSQASYFNGSAQTITVPYITPDNVTMSFWFKRNSNTGTRQFFCSLWRGISAELSTAGCPLFTVYTTQQIKATSPIAITTSDEWIHFAGVFAQGTGIKLYINGELVATYDTSESLSWSNSSTKIGIYGTNTCYLDAIMSDFRIYSSALDGADIQELYQSAATIDNEGNLYTRELFEDSETIKVNKSGILDGLQIGEDYEKTSFYKGGNVSCNALYEY